MSGGACGSGPRGSYRVGLACQTFLPFCAFGSGSPRSSGEVERGGTRALAVVGVCVGGWAAFSGLKCVLAG